MSATYYGGCYKPAVKFLSSHKNDFVAGKTKICFDDNIFTFMGCRELAMIGHEFSLRFERYIGKNRSHSFDDLARKQGGIFKILSGSEIDKRSHYPKRKKIG